MKRQIVRVETLDKHLIAEARLIIARQYFWTNMCQSLTIRVIRDKNMVILTANDRFLINSKSTKKSLRTKCGLLNVSRKMTISRQHLSVAVFRMDLRFQSHMKLMSNYLMVAVTDAMKHLSVISSEKCQFLSFHSKNSSKW